MKFLFCLAVLALALTEISAQFTKDCSKTIFEENFDKILLAKEYNRRLPENLEEFKKYFKDDLEYISKMEYYHKYCLNGTVKELFGAIIPSYKAEFEKYLNDPNSKVSVEYLKLGPCLNKNIDKVNKCYDSAVTNYASIRYAQESKKVPYTCCAFSDYMDCYVDILVTDCKKDDYGKNLKKVQHNFMTKFFETQCGEYQPGSDNCDQLDKLPQAKVEHKGKFTQTFTEVFETKEN